MPLFEQLCCNGVTLPEILERIRPCQLEMERAQMMTGCKSTARPTRALQTSTRARTVAELDIGRRTAGDQVEEQTTQKGKSPKKGKGKSKHVDVVETSQPSETAPTVSYLSQPSSTLGELSCNSNVEPWIIGVTINSVFTRRQAGAEYLLHDSGAQLHACPITYP